MSSHIETLSLEFWWKASSLQAEMVNDLHFHWIVISQNLLEIHRNYFTGLISATKIILKDQFEIKLRSVNKNDYPAKFLLVSFEMHV